MTEDVEGAKTEFVEALATFLEVNRDRNNVSSALRSRLAQARASAVQSLTTVQYDEAVFQAFRIAGHDAFFRQ